MIYLVLAIYLVSVIRVRRFIRQAHLPNGIWTGRPIVHLDFAFTFVPVINTLVALGLLTESPYVDGKPPITFKKGAISNWIFGIKKLK